MIKKISNYYLKRKLSSLGRSVTIEGNIECRNPNGIVLGDYVYIGPNAKLWGTGEIQIGNNVIIGPNLTALTTNHNYKGTMVPYDATAVCKTIVIEDNVWIAANVCIVPGVTIGEGAIVSMGTVVTKDVPPLAIVGSNRLEIIGYREESDYRRKVREDALYLKMKSMGFV